MYGNSMLKIDQLTATVAEEPFRMLSLRRNVLVFGVGSCPSRHSSDRRAERINPTWPHYWSRVVVVFRTLERIPSFCRRSGGALWYDLACNLSRHVGL